ncbi:hypothetical protein ACFSC3_05195 [Sphingomonas floccifaciens]|uniref:Flagellar FlbD family protein n=1 Tax=Sphingomonas floccifaciens TaxID=1844115 RepID=A0ABW4NA25_9SPHN
MALIVLDLRAGGKILVNTDHIVSARKAAIGVEVTMTNGEPFVINYEHVAHLVRHIEEVTGPMPMA